MLVFWHEQSNFVDQLAIYVIKIHIRLTYFHFHEPLLEVETTLTLGMFTLTPYVTSLAHI